MSGGHFDYRDCHLSDLVDEVERLITTNKTGDEYGYVRNYASDTIEEFKQAVKAIKRAQVYLHRIDYLVSGDDGEDSFYTSLFADLDKIKQSI